MTRFRLDLPAGEYDGRILADCDTAEIRIPGVGTVRVPVDAVARVAPPLPPEPPLGTAAFAELRLPHGERWRGLVLRTTGGWRTLDSEWGACVAGLTWAQLCEFSTPVRLVPDPAADAPSLPWVVRTTDDRYPDLVVDRTPEAGDALRINGFRLSANRIRTLMAICARHLKPGAERDALLSAARQARETQP